jgi:hypothetical protein
MPHRLRHHQLHDPPRCQRQYLLRRLPRYLPHRLLRYPLYAVSGVSHQLRYRSHHLLRRLPLPLLRRHRQTRRQGAIRWQISCASSCVISDSSGCSVGRFVRRAGQSRCKLGSLRGHHLRRPPCLCGHACSHAAN